ncbi:MAG: DUF169 domain-containing protein [Actinomycetota bacterium]|nr:DUF169 domain-containing protein [Actinomycetota bacterium]
MDLPALDEALSRYLRLDSFPIAAAFTDQEPPEGTRPASRMAGGPVTTCQVYGMARIYGWAMSATAQDLACALGMVAIGFAAPTDDYSSGKIAASLYTRDEQVGAEMEAAVPKLELGRYRTFLVAPLHRVAFEPQVIALYGNAAQVMRMVNAVLYHGGSRVEGLAQGRLDCADLLVHPIQSGEPAFVLPCNGDRIFGGVQDHEMAFTMPASWADKLVEGLEETHRKGVRYPIPRYLRYSPRMPASYEEMREEIRRREG